MRLHNPFGPHTRTKFIQLNRHACQACWTCIGACPNHVIGQAKLGRHAHAHIDQAEQCTGCKQCVRACPHGALAYIYQTVKEPEEQ